MVDCAILARSRHQRDDLERARLRSGSTDFGQRVGHKDLLKAGAVLARKEATVAAVRKDAVGDHQVDALRAARF